MHWHVQFCLSARVSPSHSLASPCLLDARRWNAEQGHPTVCWLGMQLNCPQAIRYVAACFLICGLIIASCSSKWMPICIDPQQWNAKPRSPDCLLTRHGVGLSSSRQVRRSLHSRLQLKNRQLQLQMDAHLYSGCGF